MHHTPAQPAADHPPMPAAAQHCHNPTGDITRRQQPGIIARVVITARADACHTNVNDPVHHQASPIRRLKENHVTDAHRPAVIWHDVHQGRLS
jgi:hypothetical protein